MKCSLSEHSPPISLDGEATFSVKIDQPIHKPRPTGLPVEELHQLSVHGPQHEVLVTEAGHALVA